MTFPNSAVVDVPGDVAAARLGNMADDRNCFETRGGAYLEQVRRQYLAWVSMRQVPVISGLQPVGAIAEQTSGLIEMKAAVITHQAAGHNTRENA